MRWVALALITALAAALRLVDLGAVRLDPFYDAAVRSMGVSWHNFFFGAYEPGGSVSIDKPPVDLWLQVASVKLLGWGSTSLKLPEALAGTLSVPLLYAAVKRPFGVTAGLVAALALAVLPIEVITARSDTMDAVMMLLLVLALLMVVRACETGKTAWLLAAAATLGVAFNVKLLESVVALPGLFVLAWLGLPRTSEDGRGAEFARAHGQVRRRRRRLCRGRAVVAGRDAAVRSARASVRDRLDERQRLERGVRLQRHRTAERQNRGSRQRPSRPTVVAAANSHRRARPSLPPPPRACLPAAASCRPSGSAGRLWRRCCSASPS